MPAYVFVQIDVHDPATYQRYIALAPESIGKYGGRYLVRGGACEALEGEWTPRRVAVLEFADMARAKAWHDSAEYAPALAIRKASADALMILVDGLPVPFEPGVQR